MCYLFWHGRYPDTPWFALTCWVVSASLATLCLISWYECLSVRTKWVSSELLFLHSSPPWTGKHVLPDSVRSLPIRRGLRAQVRNGNRYIYGQFKGRLVWTSAHVDGSSKKDPLACWSNWLFVQQTLTVPHPYVLVFTFWIVPRLGHGLTLHRCQSCPSAKLPHSLFLISFFSPTSPYLLLFIYYYLYTQQHCSSKQSSHLVEHNPCWRERLEHCLLNADDPSISTKFNSFHPRGILVVGERTGIVSLAYRITQISITDVNGGC